MKVKTGLHAPARLPVAVLDVQGAEVGRTGFLPPIRCTMPEPCGVCWYCVQYTKQSETNAANVSVPRR
jgi:hypothetical protein